MLNAVVDSQSSASETRPGFRPRKPGRIAYGLGTHTAGWPGLERTREAPVAADDSMAIVRLARANGVGVNRKTPQSKRVLIAEGLDNLPRPDYDK